MAIRGALIRCETHVRRFKYVLSTLLCCFMLLYDVMLECPARFKNNINTLSARLHIATIRPANV